MRTRCDQMAHIPSTERGSSGYDRRTVSTRMAVAAAPFDIVIEGGTVVTDGTLARGVRRHPRRPDRGAGRARSRRRSAGGAAHRCQRAPGPARWRRSALPCRHRRWGRTPPLTITPVPAWRLSPAAPPPSSTSPSRARARTRSRRSTTHWRWPPIASATTPSTAASPGTTPTCRRTVRALAERGVRTVKMFTTYRGVLMVETARSRR